jgi:3D (Asp-Asp-Asp) domain-containing protein
LQILSKKSFKILLSFGLVLAASYGLLVFFSRTVLVVGGKTTTHYSLRKGTARELLQAYGVALSSMDIVRPGLDEEIRWGQKVEVVRVTEKIEEKSEQIDFVLDWKRRTTKNLRSVEIQHGYSQKTVWTVRRVFHDGAEAEAQESARKVRKTPVTRLVFLSDRGRPQKIYDLSRTKKMTLVATAYWLGDPQAPGDETYSGHRVQRGLVAVDPKVVPLGWRLYIPGYGYAYSSDTGSAIKGSRIDLFVESKNASRAWEHRKVTVYLIEKAKTW